MTSAIEVKGLEKVFKNAWSSRAITALAGIGFAVEPGEIHGLLGPNGAGKTTTVKILLGLTFPSAGEARLLGRDAQDPESRRRAGYLPEGHRFPGYLTARQTLSIFGRMSGVPAAEAARRIPVLLERVRLSDWADVKVKKFSKGMTQRLGLAAALIHDPAVLLLDEPTDGVDPVGRREIRDLLSEEAAKGTAILLNSHLLSEIELTCDRVTVLRKGKIAASGTLSDLTTRAQEHGQHFRLSIDPLTPELLSAFTELGARTVANNGLLELAVRDVGHLNLLIDRIRAEGGRLQELVPVRSSLEDVFVDLVKTDGAASPPPPPFLEAKPQ